MTLSEHLDQLLPPGSEIRFGELKLSRSESGIFEARHVRDMDAEDPLAEMRTPRELRELAKYDGEGNYRPLKSAPGLRGGWSTKTDSPEAFLKRLDAIYPGVFATTSAYLEGRIDPVPLRETLNRQTGMYRITGTITSGDANQIMRELCSPGCLRSLAWPIEGTSPTSRLKMRPGVLPLMCVEACTFAVGFARKLAKAKP